MTVSQGDFAAALLDPGHAVPKGLIGPGGTPAGRRFAVYRNNVAVSLTEALRTAFPVVKKLVGDEFFNAMAGIYLRAHPPSSPLMMFYGKEMPGFLEAFEPVRHLGYLPDIARLELALRACYHAADAAPIDPGDLARISPGELLDLRMTLAPALGCVASQWPIHAIWKQNMEEGPRPEMRAETLLLTRPDLDPVLRVISPEQSRFISALGHGECLGSAMDQAGGTFDLSATLGLLLTDAAIVGLSIKDAAQ